MLCRNSDQTGSRERIDVPKVLDAFVPIILDRYCRTNFIDRFGCERGEECNEENGMIASKHFGKKKKNDSMERGVHLSSPPSPLTPQSRTDSRRRASPDLVIRNQLLSIRSEWQIRNRGGRGGGEGRRITGGKQA